MDNMKIAYLASPFAHPDDNIKQQRLQAVNRYAAMCHQKGKLVYSPLTHNIPLSEAYGELASWNAWGDFDRAMLARCDELIVLMLDGWKESKGVAHEIQYAIDIKIPIVYHRLVNP